VTIADENASSYDVVDEIARRVPLGAAVAS
jgi:hypothetical protein